MKKALMVFILLFLSSNCCAQNVKVGTFEEKDYYLKTESIRYCSTPSCIYIDGQEQSYIGAIFIVPSNEARHETRGDVLTPSKDAAYETKAILFSTDGTKFVLTSTASYDVNNNFIGSKDETVEIVEVETTLMVKDKETGQEKELKSKVSDKLRRIIWSPVQPGAASGIIASAVFGYVEANYPDVILRSKANIISAKRQ